MNTGKYIFAQMIEFLPQRIFDGFVAKYEGNKYVNHFSCWNQLLVMMFGQLSNRDSLRDLILAIEAHSQKKYHLGFGNKNLSKNELLIKEESQEMAQFFHINYLTILYRTKIPAEIYCN